MTRPSELRAARPMVWINEPEAATNNRYHNLDYSSDDGSAMIAYNADSGALMGSLYHYPATEGRGGEMRQVYDWDSGVSSD